MVSDLGIAVLVALVALQSLVAYRTYRRQTDRTPAAVDAAADGTATAAVDDVVACPECGTENEAEYRYCRQCVGELPGGEAFDRGPDRPLGRVV